MCQILNIIKIGSWFQIVHHNFLNFQKTILPPFQIVGRFGFSRFIDIIMHLDIVIHNNIYKPRKVKTTYNLEQMDSK
jgi:hypothetical protein